MTRTMDRSFSSELQSQVGAGRARISASHAVERLWVRDHRLWKEDPTEITNRLGWRTIIEYMKDRTEELRTFTTSAEKRGIRDVVLLGMGGSSLGPQVLRATFGPLNGFPRVWVLDSTVPGWVRQVTQSIDPARSLFILASKSGGTIEVMPLFAHFWELVPQAPRHQSGAQFVTITNPGTGLEKLAAAHQFWRIFTHPPDIGGRYSVISYFGLVPAALMGINVARLLARATAMAQACRIQSPLEQNPGAALGAAMTLLAEANPILPLTLQDRYDLAAEFFRWEVVTALVGHLLGIHPFDQPNVQESKDNTARGLATVQSTGRWPKQVTATVVQAAAQLKRHCRPGAYVAILAYTTPSSKMEQAIRSLRRTLVSYHHVTTKAGYGPRYLHSTGQPHKGGPRNGLFLQLVDQMIPDLNISEKPFTFRTLAQAQAAGDVQALQAHGQQAIVVSLGKNPIATIQSVTKSLAPRRAARRPAVRGNRIRRACKK
jgi:glucose-6-phosphate isomerase